MIIKQATSAVTPAVGPISFFNQFAKRTAIAAGRNKQHHKVLYRPSQHHAGEDPDHPRQVAHLRGEHRAHQRPRAGNGGKMVTEQHFLSVGT